jgi:hypothetical protein
MRCTSGSNYAWNITTCWERPTRSVTIHLNWKLQDRSFAKGSLWPGRAKAEFKWAAGNQSSEAGQLGEF